MVNCEYVSNALSVARMKMHYLLLSIPTGRRKFKQPFAVSAEYKLRSKYTKGVPNNTTRRIFRVLANVSRFRGAAASRDIGESNFMSSAKSTKTPITTSETEHYTF
ncbi:hypothetical protein HZH66_006742 [Vespula vulgaris]|uniref:Uncharacterized protein n=1 Tax=Vespula vulgaris TaxID=7454 RepID=A0A834K2V0_VESVU|nr:hypothetical protein HZH66_006742 [Vespula vulgaris]